ncbi:hypothetical protein EDD17DRAFT_1508657 [Pisolithus thermaeus]|nr:hypothetical protein EDD17DRAFT_1508657 [Pisolithus thermaeus]
MDTGVNYSFQYTYAHLDLQVGSAGHTRGKTSSILKVESIEQGAGWTSILEVGSMDHAGGWRMAFHPDPESWVGGLYQGMDTHPGSGDFSSESSVSVLWWGMDFLPESEMRSLNLGREDFPLEVGLVDHGEGGLPPENKDQCTTPGMDNILDVFPPESRASGLWSGMDFLPESGDLSEGELPSWKWHQQTTPRDRLPSWKWGSADHDKFPSWKWGPWTMLGDTVNSYLGSGAS